MKINTYNQIIPIKSQCYLEVKQFKCSFGLSRVIHKYDRRSTEVEPLIIAIINHNLKGQQ